MSTILRLCYFLLLLALFADYLFAQGGKIQGKITDESGNAVPFGSVLIEGTTMGGGANADGEYSITNVPAGTHSLRASVIGYRQKREEVTVTAGGTVTQDFVLAVDVLRGEEVVVTGTMTPRTKLESTVAISTLSPQEVAQASPRSTTEILRYIPGFTRVESSGGEVNQNISVRGILGVEYVMFMEDGLPVFPTMHTFFMNADNLFRMDENIDKVEVVRGGNSALFGSNTPGAIINFINKTGGPTISGSVKATGATENLARYDFNVNGPLAEAWRFNLGGFYRYDNGVRDPGFPGVRGGQIKAGITRLLDNGYVRVSTKVIDDRNQFILPLPFKDPNNPEYVQGFSEYGSMNSAEGNHIAVPTPDGQLQLPLEDGLRTKAYWLTADVALNFAGDWSLQNVAQIMQNDQGWNAILPFDVLSYTDYIAGLNLPAGSTGALFYTNVYDGKGNKLPFDASYNGLVSPAGEWHVEKPLAAFQDQMTIKKQFGEHKLSAGIYFANYTQTNRWYFTDILIDVRDNPHFLDLVVYTPTDTVEYTKNGFRRYLSLYRNGSGSTTIFSALVGDEIQLTENLRVDIGFRYESDYFVQSAENSSTVDLDADTTSKYDIVPWGNSSYRHFQRTISDWAGSFGLNYTLSENISLSVQASRAYKMPALDEFLDASAQTQVDLFESRQTLMVEAGVKYSSVMLGFMVNGFYGELKNIIGQGAEVDPATGNLVWKIRRSPDNRVYGVELELSANPVSNLTVLAAGTFLEPQTVEGSGSALTAGGIPSVIGNLSGTYKISNLNLTADWHFVGSRDLINADYDPATGKYKTYQNIGELQAYSYLNLGAGYKFAGSGVSLTASLMNVLQSTGLEEGNPRLPTAGGKNLFLARPILPRRLMATLGYQF